MARLLVVEDAFAGRGRGVLVTPKVTVEKPTPGTFSVRLRLPDGRERVAAASFDVAHIRGALPPFAMLRLAELTPEDVPAGTEVWTLD